MSCEVTAFYVLLICELQRVIQIFVALLKLLKWRLDDSKCLMVKTPSSVAIKSIDTQHIFCLMF